jgi:hypothetical protein
MRKLLWGPLATLLLFIETSCDGGGQPSSTVPYRMVLSHLSLSMPFNSTQDVSATVFAEDGTVLSPTIRWSSGLPDIVTLNGRTTTTGAGIMIQAVKEGVTSVEAVVDGTPEVRASINTLVQRAPVHRLEISGETQFPPGLPFGFSVAAYDSRGNDTSAGRLVSWASSNSAVVSVEGNGLVATVRGNMHGTANVSAKCEGVVAICPVTIVSSGIKYGNCRSFPGMSDGGSGGAGGGGAGGGVGAGGGSTNDCLPGKPKLDGVWHAIDSDKPVLHRPTSCKFVGSNVMAVTYEFKLDPTDFTYSCPSGCRGYAMYLVDGWSSPSKSFFYFFDKSDGRPHTLNHAMPISRGNDGTLTNSFDAVSQWPVQVRNNDPTKFKSLLTFVPGCVDEVDAQRNRCPVAGLQMQNWP